MSIKSVLMTGALLVGISMARTATAAEEFGVGKDGFIRDWLLLAPIQLAADADGGEAIDKSQVADEAALKPKAGDKATVSGKEFAWKKVKATESFLDINAVLNKETEKTMGYMVCYIKCDAERKDLQLKMGSNDQGKVYLNGKALIKAADPRGLEQDSDVARNVTLKEGINVIVFKVFNEGNDWQGCLRFTDASGRAVTNLVVVLEP